MKINPEKHYLWRADDHKVEVLETYVTKSWDREVARAFLKKLKWRRGKAKVWGADQ